ALVERPAVAVGGEDHALFVEVAASLRERDGHSAGEGHVALTALEGPAGHDHGHERSGAGGLDGEAWAPKVEAVGDTSGEEVLVVPHHDLVAAHQRDEGRVRIDLAKDVG